MSDPRAKKETARGAANTADGMEDQVVGTANHSKKYRNTSFSKEQDRPIGTVELFLMASGAVGEENAIPSRREKDALDYADIRSFRSALECERQRGAVICGNSCGIYLPRLGARGIPELEQYIRTTQARIGEMSLGLSAIKRELHRRRHADQLELGERGDP